MFRLIGFCLLCILAVASGVAAVSVPISGRTVAEHVRARFEPAPRPARAPTTPTKAAPRPTRTATPTRPASTTRPSKEAVAARVPPPDAPITGSERSALDDLIAERAGTPSRR